MATKAKKVHTNNGHAKKVKTKEDGGSTFTLNDDGMLRMAAMVNNLFTQRQEMLRDLTEPKRDIDKECGYPAHLDIDDYKGAWDRDALARRIISILPQEMWALDPELYEVESPKRTTAFEKRWNQLVDDLNIWHYLERIDIMAGIGQFGALLLGFDDGGGLAAPMPGVQDDPLAPPGPGMKETNLVYLRPFDQSSVTIKEWEENDSSPRFQQPLVYEFMLRENVKREVHWTRVLHVPSDSLESSEVLGTPRLQPVWHRLHDLRKIYGGSAEMFWRGGFPGYAFEIDPQVEFGDEERKQFKEEMYKFFETMQRHVAAKGLKAHSLEVQVADPTRHIEAQLRNITLSIGIPFKVFIGSEEAKLASSQDVKNLNRRLVRREEKFAGPIIVRPFAGRLIQAGVLPKPKSFHLHWPDLNTLSRHEKAQVAKLMTDSMAKYMQWEISKLIPPMEFLTLILHFSQAEAKMIMDAVEKMTKLQRKELVPGLEAAGDRDEDEKRREGAAPEDLEQTDTDENETSTVQS
jgi:uncharacterized protein